MLFVDALMIYLVRKMRSSSTPHEGRWIMRSLYLTMLFFVIAFIISSII